MADDEYNNKLRSLQQYIPFLENMITQLKDPSKKNREQQLNKMESLYAMITDKKKKLKLETLNKCEDVITKLFEKVNHKTLNINTVKKDQTYSPQSTPASPSPEPNDYVNPTTIPTERLEPKSHLPKVDIYSSAAESLRKLNTCNKESLPAYSAKCPDLTKPPISLDDLRCLEVDVQVKINENASLSELKKMRNKIATELMFEDIKSISKPGNAESSRSGLDRSNKSSTVACSGSSSDKICTKKFEPITIKPKPVPRTLKEPHSVFGNVLSNIDEKLYEDNKKKTERRSSASKEESITKDNESKRERRHSKETRVEKDEKKGKNIRSDDKGSKDRTPDKKDSNEENIICIDKTAESNTTKSNTEPSSIVKNTKYYDLTGTKSFKGKESPCAKIQTLSTSSINRTVIIIDDDDSPANDKNDQPIVIDDNSSPKSKREENDRAKTDQSQTTQEFRRLADKYNPKPRKRSVDVINVEEEIVNVMSPIPSITISPDPPPHLATCTSQPFDKEFGPFKTNSSLPAQPKPFVTSVIPNQVQSSHQSTMDNFVSEYAREEFQSVNRRPNHLNVPLGHSPILMSPKDNFPSDSTRENFGSSQHRRFNYEPTSHHRYGPPPPNQRYFKNFNQKFREPPMLDFQPPNNIPLTQNNPSHHVYDHRPPVLSPETPHYREPKHNFGNHMNRDTFLPKDDLRWRLGDSRTPWDRSEHESRFRGPMTYKEHREMRENSRDPRLLRDPRNNRERLTSPENKSRECRDTFKNKETEPVQNTRDPRVNRDYTDSERSKSRYRYDSRFDRLYSATNKDLPSKSFSKETDTFMSPLDSLYSGKETKRTGKGYGVQPFRIPKKKKEGEKDEKESVVDIDNSSQDSEPKVATKESVKQLEPEFIDNSSEIFKETEENDKNVKEDQAILKTNIEDANIEAIEESATATETNNEQEVSTEPQENNTTKTNEPEKREERKQPSTEQTILANFFGNLLSSQNKKDKKSALYSLISTFSDTFSTKELAKITKIINANDEDDSSDDQEKVVADKPKEDSKSDEVEQKPVEKDEKVEPSSDVAKEESEPEEEIALPKRRCRTRRISSYTSPTKDKLDDTAIKESVESPVTNDEAESPTDKVVVTVSERIKSRKRGAKKPKKKCRSELDKLHEDIKEMFIRDGVLTASGKRMCNLLKDDPCVLANDTFKLDSNESVKGRKKPMTNLKIADEMAMKAMKNVRVLIQKIPDVEETATVRRLTRSMTASEDQFDDSAEANKEDFDEEGNSEVEKESSSNADAQKRQKRKRLKSNWASGIIKKKKKKQSSADDTQSQKSTDDDLQSQKSSNSEESSSIHDKGYYLDFSSPKSQKCKLCDYIGTKITTHYVFHHKGSEVLSSRFSPSMATEAIHDAKNNLAKYESHQMAKNSQLSYTCRFCQFQAYAIPTIFYDHLSRHTGEYRHLCPNCHVAYRTNKVLKAHMKTKHLEDKKPIVRKSHDNVILFGYLCGKCNYVQILKENMDKHVKAHHSHDSVVHKINLSTHFDERIETWNHKVNTKESNANTDSSNKKSGDKKVAKSSEPIKKKYPIRTKYTKKDDDSQSSDKDGDDNSSEDEESAPTLHNEQQQVSKVDSFRPVRAKRAAKEKAQEKMKVIMEMGEFPNRKKTSLAENNEDSTNKLEFTPENKKHNTFITKEPMKDASKEIKQSMYTSVTDYEEDDKKNKLIETVGKDIVKVKKEVEMNVFTCNTDIQEENKKIEQERLQKMEELNRSFGSRTSLNFVDKLCDRLNQSNVTIKDEPQEEFVDTKYHTLSSKSPDISPILEKTATLAADKAPAQSRVSLLESLNSNVAAHTFDVAQKNDKNIMNMIEKLKGNLGVDDNFKLEDQDVDEIDNDSPPPLTYINQIKSQNLPVKTLEICGLLKVVKTEESTTFSCLVPPCVFFTENEQHFHDHCKEGHVSGLWGRSSSLCEMCGMEINKTDDANLLENVYKHLFIHHGDFIKSSNKLQPVPATSMIRLRKLSGDALSLSASLDVEHNDVANVDISNQTSIIEQSESAKETDDNPFSFKITDVISLAGCEPQVPEDEDKLQISLNESRAPGLVAEHQPTVIRPTVSLGECQPPPLTPILKVTRPLLVKEAKMSTADILKPKKSTQALNKFIAEVGNLYKCPQFTCTYSTIVRELLEQHLKTHDFDKNEMVPCVYCDLRTPWEHVGVHIDIRHSNCKFTCSYCLYRACAKNYVFLHQDKVHPFQDYSVIVLRAQKNQKKFHIADSKIDLKTLCEPFRCHKACNVQFLFENEFTEHLNQYHYGQRFFTCGHEDCSSRMVISKMVHHWSVAHAVSTYQCAYCKTNSNELKLMYYHLAMSHQHLLPEIFVRIVSPKPNYTLGYNDEAFKRMRKITSLPNILEGWREEKLAVPCHDVTVPVSPVKVASAQSNASNKSPLASTSVKLSPGSTVTATSDGLLLVASKSVGAIKLGSPLGNPVIAVKSPESKLNLSGTNSLLIPSINSNMQTSLLNTAKTIQEESIPFNSGQQLVSLLKSANATITSTATSSSFNTNATSTSSSNLDVSVPARPDDVNSNVAPLEHINLNEENNQDYVSESEVDPLDLGDANTFLSLTYSSEDEGDNGKAKKKIGLLGYQLFRCAFCEFSCSNGNDFKKHVTKSSTCRSATNSNRPFECVHCKKAFKHSHVLVEHVHTHGVLRYSCSLCGNKFPTCSQARTHMRSRHSITQTTQTLLNSASTSFSMGNEEFIIKPKLLLDESVAVNETTSDELSADVLNSKNVYNPDEIDKIPIRSIFITNLQCGVCTYATKVRTNLVRHLQFHLQEKAVPVSAPVNPVPCLEKNEKMFDKMVNLASSSHKSGSRMGSSTAKTENKDAIKCPEFVPSHTRYACCAESCNYLCPEEANLRHHLTALHDGETSFVCVHCKVPIVPADAEALIKHLKLHGLQLYKCQYCSFHHNLKHKVERHSNDSHIDLPNKVVTVRNLESETSDDTNSSAPSNQNKSTKLWRCLMCKFRGNSEEAIRSHVWDKHEIDSQYKCALCLYKTDDKSTFSSHYNDHHPNYDVHIISSYRQNTEQANKDDKEINNFDTTPLWQRDRPRIKHIRGILFDESVPSSSKSPNKKVGKSSGAAAKNVSKNLDLAIESVAKGDSVLPDPDSKSSNSVKKSEDDEVCELAEGTSDVIVIDDDDDNEGASTTSKTAAKPPTKRKRLRLVAVGPKDKLLRLEGSTDVSNGKTNDAKSDNVDVDDDDDESEKSLKLSFGEFGLPLNKQLKCPKCEKFKSKRISDFMFHLFKENRVHRYKCGICGDESITYRYMSKHVKEHGHKFNINDIIPMKKNIRLELWLQMLIRSQCTKIAPILTHIPDASPNDKNKVSCRYCSRWFKSEQDRIEHTLTHWFAMPFKCLECNRTTYNRDQMENHFAQFHRGVALNFNEVGPTVAKELQHSDYLHMKEVEEQHLFKNNDEEVPIPPSPYADTTGESKQQNSTEAEKPAKAADPIEKPFKPVEELVIISKTDSNVPQNGDVYCCDYCAYMSNSEPIMMDHFFEDHQNANVKFKVLNQRICNSKKEDYIGCMFCDEVGSEITIRQHHMNVHEHETFLYYRYTCNICKKKFLKTTGLKLHSQRIHPDAAVTYTDVFNNIITSAAEKVSKEKVQSTNVAAPNRNLLSLLTPAAKIWKRYQCTECSYRRDFPSSSITNVRNHVKTHFKAYACEECGLKFKNKPDALVHFRKDHPDAEECILYDKDVQDSFNECMRIIQSEAIRIENPNTHHISTTSKECATARKSTSAFYYRPLEEFSYYGNPVEKLDMSKIMSTVEINGICMDMTADKLGKLFDLDPIVEVIKMQTSDEESEDVDIVS